jgi:ribosome production factor 2
MMRGTDMS